MMTLTEAVNEGIARFRRNSTKAATAPRTPAPKPKGPKTWADAVAYIQIRDGVSLAEAGRKAFDEWPQLHPVNKARRGRAAK